MGVLHARRVSLSACLVMTFGFPACAPIGAPDPVAELDPRGARDIGSADLGLAGAVPIEVLAPGDPVPGFELVDTAGNELTDTSLRDLTWALTFFELRSPDPDLCPALLARFLEVQEALRPDLWARTALVAVTVDPERDSPAALRAWGREHGVDPSRLRLLTGDYETVSRLAAAFGVVTWEREDGTVAHTLTTVVVAPGGRIADGFPGTAGWRATDLLASLVHSAER